MDATYFLLLSSLGLVITTQAQNCTRPPGGENMNLKDSYILLDTFPDGTKVSFACAVGYMAAGGSPSITCTAGSWSPLRLKCERRNCGPAEEVLNGHVEYPQGTEFGDQLVVICNEGFRLVGRNNKRLCEAQGWGGKMPECEAMTCDRPPPVESGAFKPDKDNYQYGEVVEYSCQKDYTLSGSKTATCSANEMFEPAPPTCINVECKDPVIANADWIEGSRPPHRYQSTVTYRCRSGYTMIGESILTCGVDSQWSPGLPTCEHVQCKDPVIANADWIGGSQPPHRYQSMVMYRCRSGYIMIGESTLTCGVDGQWSPGLPTCERSTTPKATTPSITSPPPPPDVQCKDPVIANADWIGGSQPPHRYQSMVMYRCRSGYIMIGESTLTCGVDGQWSPGLPTCKLRTCEEPHIKNADRIGGQPPYVHQSLVTYKCKSGYKMKGEPTLTCGTDGRWSPELPECQADSEIPAPPGNGGRSLALGLGIGLPVCIIALCFCGCYFCGFPCIKTKRGSRSGIPDNVVPKDGEDIAL